MYWDPTIVSGEDIFSDVYTRCSPFVKFTQPSFEIQKMLTDEFPKHFQLYLGDGIGGYGEDMDQYWGVAPDSHTVRNPEDGSWNRDYPKFDDSD